MGGRKNEIEREEKKRERERERVINMIDNVMKNEEK